MVIDGANQSPTLRAAFGLAVVSNQAADEALGGNLAALPDPLVNIDSDLWYGYFPVTMAFADQSTGEGLQLNYESKAKRKIDDGESIVLVFRQQNTSAETVSGSFVIRFLSKLKRT